MKKYDVKIKTVSENTVTVFASCESEAVNKVEELIATSNIKDIDIKGITKHYVIIDIIRRSLFNRNRK